MTSYNANHLPKGFFQKRMPPADTWLQPGHEPGLELLTSRNWERTCLHYSELQLWDLLCHNRNHRQSRAPRRRLTSDLRPLTGIYRWSPGVTRQLLAALSLASESPIKGCLPCPSLAPLQELCFLTARSCSAPQSLKKTALNSPWDVMVPTRLPPWVVPTPGKASP